MLNYNINRKEAYQFYRSIGFSPTEARKIRSRGFKKIIADYARERKKANKDFKTGKIDKWKRIHRPRVRGTDKSIKVFIKKIKAQKVAPKIIRLMQKDTAINQDIYMKRIKGFKKFFTEKNQNWNEMMGQLNTMSDLGDMLDFLGERYEDLKGESEVIECNDCGSTEIFKYIKLKKGFEPFCKPCSDKRKKKPKKKKKKGK